MTLEQIKQRMLGEWVSIAPEGRPITGVGAYHPRTRKPGRPRASRRAARTDNDPDRDDRIRDSEITRHKTYLPLDDSFYG